MASFTLTTYLFHLPLLVLFWDVLHTPPWVCLLSLAGSIFVIGCLTEHRRRELRALLAIIVVRPFGRLSSPRAGMKHPAAPEPVRLGEANLLEPEVTQHGFDTAADSESTSSSGRSLVWPRMELHHRLSDVTHRHASLDDQRIRGEIGNPF